MFNKWKCKEGKEIFSTSIRGLQFNDFVALNRNPFQLLLMPLSLYSHGTNGTKKSPNKLILAEKLI